MADLTIQPSLKFIKMGTILAAIVFVGLEILYLIEWRDSGNTWVMALPPLIFLWPLERLFRRRFMRVTVSGDRLRYEVGMMSRVTRNIQLSKLQDARVEQRFLQRMLNVGDLSIETAGESSRLTIVNVDDPQGLADEIMNRAQSGEGFTRRGHGI